MCRPGLAALALAGISLAFAACGEDDERYNDAKIVDKLNLEEVDGEQEYAMDGDPFCSVERRLLNTSDEVEAAIEELEINLVVSSREGNVGVIGVPVFADDCREAARRKLSRLDREPAD